NAKGGGVSVTASDDTSIRGDTGGYAVSLAGSLGGGGAGAGALGASESDNEIGTKSGQSVEAYIDNATVTAAADVTLSASSTATIWSLAIGASLAGGPSPRAGPARTRAGRGARTLCTAKQKTSA